MIKEEIIVKTKEEFYREMDNFKFGFNSFSTGVLTSGIVNRTKIYRITDYAAPVDTLVVSEASGDMYYSSGEDNSAVGELIVFADGRTSKTDKYNCHICLHKWKWDNNKDAITFLRGTAREELGSVLSCQNYPQSQAVEVSYNVELTVRLIEDKPEPTFEKGEKVLVWDCDKKASVVNMFDHIATGSEYPFVCHLCYRERLLSWKHCAKICQVCEKEVCECKFNQLFKCSDPGLYGPEYNCSCLPTFKKDELVLVWDVSKSHAKLRYFKQKELDCYFTCWPMGTTSLTAGGHAKRWENCVKVCQKCGKERCECK